MYKNDFKCQHLQVIHNVIVLIPFFFSFGLLDEGYMIIIVIAGVVLALSVAAVVSKYSTFPWNKAFCISTGDKYIPLKPSSAWLESA